MSNAVLVLGKTGSGKSTSIENLDPNETFIINVVGKDLPFRGGRKRYTTEKKNYFATSDNKQIIQVMNQISKEAPHIKTLIIDDFQYVMSYEFMARAKETGFKMSYEFMARAKETGFNKFTEIAEHAFNIINTSKNLREDLTVIFLTHVEENTDSLGQVSYKIKTIGKLLDEKITIEGLFTVVLMAKIDKNQEGNVEYVFETRGDVNTTVKSPKGMFETDTIPNDLKIVIDKIDEYNNAE
jgi:predicted amino acid-binding ACT domain protein